MLPTPAIRQGAHRAPGVLTSGPASVPEGLPFLGLSKGQGTVGSFWDVDRAPPFQGSARGQICTTSTLDTRVLINPQ